MVQRLERIRKGSPNVDLRPFIALVEADSEQRRATRNLIESLNFPCHAFAAASELLDHAPQGLGCVLFDLGVTDMTEALFQSMLRAQGSTAAIVVTGPSDIDPSEVAAAIKQGAFDFAQKPIGRSRMIDLIQGALRSEARLRMEYFQCKQLTQRLATLSQRERAVLDLVVEGLANKQIAARLGISQRTVEAHRTRLMQKMDADSAAQLAHAMGRYHYCNAMHQQAGCPLTASSSPAA